MKTPDPTLILYHADCPDGFGAAWSYHRRYGDSPRYIPVEYQLPLDSFPDVTGDDVVMVDVSAEQHVLESLRSRTHSFRLLDHHASAAKQLDKLPFTYFDLGHSGAWLAWQDCFKEPAPPLVNYLQDRDLYTWKLSDAKAITLALDCEPHTFEAWDEFNRRLEQDYDSVVKSGHHILRYVNMEISRIAQKARLVNIGGVPVALAPAPHWLANEAALASAAICDTNIGVTWDVDTEGKISLSLRTSNDAGERLLPTMAKALGGGGHPRASGAKITPAQLYSLLQNGFLNFQKEPGEDPTPLP